MSQSQIVVTLTTTPARMGHLGPTLKSILNQSRAPDRVSLYLPRAYRRKEFSDYRLPALPEGVDVRVCDLDFGPATKVLPAVRDYAGTDTMIIYCDDDQVYDPHWIDRLCRKSRAFPGDCIADRGLRVAKLDARSKPKDIAYRLRRLASLGRWRPLKQFDAGTDGIVDIALGFSGVLVRPEFFTQSAFDIPDVLWTVDDIWLSGNLAVNGITCRQASDVRLSANGAAANMAALLDFEIDGYGRAAANLKCVDYFRARYGIWPA